MKKIFIILIYISILFCNTVFADDSLEIEDYNSFSSFEVSSINTNEPIINSKNVIVIDRKTLLPLYEKNAYSKVAMASTTKILTCIIALETCSKSEIVTGSSNAANISGSTLGLKKNTTITVNDLLYGLMLRSGNDCAIAIAEHISGSVKDFAKIMNYKAFELGLLSSNFVTPHGLDNPDHYTTAYDLALLTDYALKNSDFKKIVSTKIHTISFNNSCNTISNTNELLGNLDGVYGVKTGFTFEAGRCLVSACNRNNFDIIVVVLGADTKPIRTKDSLNLINYVFNNYHYINVANLVKENFSNYIFYFNKMYSLEKTSSTPHLDVEPLENYEFPIPQKDTSNLNTKIYVINNFSSKILPNTTVGKLHVYNNNQLLCTINILLENQLINNDWKFYFTKIISYYK